MPDDRRPADDEFRAVTICAACEDLLARIGPPSPGGDADRALRRLRARLDALLAGAPPPAASRAAPPPLEVLSLGATALRAGGREIAPPRRSRLVLQYLVAHREAPVPRDVLLEAFWPGSPPAAARNSLNVAVTLLRRALRPAYGDHPVVIFREGAYRLDPRIEVRVDREEYERLVRRGTRCHRAGDHVAAVRLLGAARALHRGPLFADEPHERWIASLRRALADGHLAMLTALAGSLAAVGARDEAAEVLREVLHGDPEREDAHRLLMDLHLADGRAHLALRQYDACREALRRRRGTEPGPQTRAARERILRGGERARADRPAPMIAA